MGGATVRAMSDDAEPVSAPAPEASPDLPLKGVLVADFSRVLAGPLATMTLADLGADVVKVERPGVGDETRAWGPPFTEHGTTYYASVNRTKRSIALDLNDPADRALAGELARRADVVIENFKPGTMERLGLGYDDLRRVNPGVIYCSISGFGATGGRDLLGYDFVVQAASGLMSITGTPDEATKVGVAVVDVLTGKDAVIGILAALHARGRDGEGERLEISLLTSALGGLANQAQAALATGTSPARMGNKHPSIAPYETLRCADREIAVACGNDGQFRRLAAALERPELADDPRFATNAARVAHRLELIAALEEVLLSAPAAHWVAVCGAAQVPAGVVGTILDGIELAEQLGLEPTVTVGAGHAPQVRHPVRWARRGTATPTPPPTLGEHDSALRAWLSAPLPSVPHIT